MLAKGDKGWWTWQAKILLIVLLWACSRSVVRPFRQALMDELECNALCLGRITSMKSALELFSAPALGRLSDLTARKLVLYISIFSNVVSVSISLVYRSMYGVYLSGVPDALFSYALFGISKALIADLSTSDAELQRALGTIGA